MRKLNRQQHERQKNHDAEVLRHINERNAWRSKAQEQEDEILSLKREIDRRKRPNPHLQRPVQDESTRATADLRAELAAGIDGPGDSGRPDQTDAPCPSCKATAEASANLRAQLDTARAEADELRKRIAQVTLDWEHDDS